MDVSKYSEFPFVEDFNALSGESKSLEDIQRFISHVEEYERRVDNRWYEYVIQRADSLIKELSEFKDPCHPFMSTLDDTGIMNVINSTKTRAQSFKDSLAYARRAKTDAEEEVLNHVI